MVVNDTIQRSGKAVPESPKAADRVGAGGIVWMFSKEVTIIDAGGGVRNGAGVEEGAGETNLDKIPTGT
jgi:hypothetical protein